jgi:ribosomal protein S27AE
VCTNALLREFHGRLVCDECAGMQIASDDFAASLHEIDGATDPLEVVRLGVSSVGCPQCPHPMTTCTLRLGSLALAGTFLGCARHGIWIPREAMTAAFARVSRRGGFRGLGAVGAGGGGQDRGGGGGAPAIANVPSGHGGMSGPMASIRGAFSAGAPASSRLAISHWQARRPRVHTLYVSAHKDRRLGCPACRDRVLGYHGDRWTCEGCGGGFVENAALVAMIEEMANGPWALPDASGTPGERPCPICSAAMVVEPFEGVTIDRCSEHGVWFDDSELQAALHHVADPPTGLGAWLKRLFQA